jgi:SAM-dependent methyltransferase
MDFLNRLPPKFELLDVGCGSNSPYLVKTFFPGCVYTGIDASDYRQTKPNLADKYVFVDSKRFPEGILELGEKFDAVVSSHNIEHCDDREATLKAMMAVLKDGGRLYISFPTETSVGFPSRAGCLNYYDDPTHQAIPPDFGAVVNLLCRNGFSILYRAKRYQPLIFWTVGLLSEPISQHEVEWKELGNITVSSLSSGRRRALYRRESLIILDNSVLCRQKGRPLLTFIDVGRMVS